MAGPLQWSDRVYSFPVASTTTYHRLGGFKRQEFVLTALEATSPKLRCQQGPSSLTRALGEGHLMSSRLWELPAFPSLEWHLSNLSLSAQDGPLPMPHWVSGLSLSLSLIRTPILDLGWAPNPGCSHIESLNLITSVRTPNSKQGPIHGFWGLGLGHPFGDTIQSTTQGVDPCS